MIVYGNNGTIVRARTVNQLKLVQSYDRNDLRLAIGPAAVSYTHLDVYKRQMYLSVVSGA